MKNDQKSVIGVDRRYSVVSGRILKVEVCGNIIELQMKASESKIFIGKEK